MRYCPKPSLFDLAGLLMLAALLFHPMALHAEGIEVKSAELEMAEDALVLNADIDISLNPALEDALNKGVPLNFITDFELKKPRWYWFDETVVAVQQHIRLSYHALTRQYQLSSNGQFQNFASLGDARRELGRLRGWQVTDKGRAKKGTAYVANLRMKLDLTQLPKPLQVNALASKEWNLDSEWHRWNFTS